MWKAPVEVKEKEKDFYSSQRQTYFFKNNWSEWTDQNNMFDLAPCNCYVPSPGWVRAVLFMTTVNCAVADEFIKEKTCEHERRHEVFAVNCLDSFLDIRDKDSGTWTFPLFNFCNDCREIYENHKKKIDLGNVLFGQYNNARSNNCTNNLTVSNHKCTFTKENLFPNYRSDSIKYRNEDEWYYGMQSFEALIFINLIEWHHMSESCFMSVCSKCVNYVKEVIASNEYIKHTVKPMLSSETIFKSHGCSHFYKEFGPTYDLNCNLCILEVIQELITEYAVKYPEELYSKLIFTANYIVKCVAQGYFLKKSKLNCFRKKYTYVHKDRYTSIKINESIVCETCFTAVQKDLEIIFSPLDLFICDIKKQTISLRRCPIDTAYLYYVQEKRNHNYFTEQEKKSLHQEGLLWNKM